MSGISTSLVIVSRDRPKHLARLLKALRFQTHSSFEVIVVGNSDPKPIDQNIKYVPFDQPNISAARNIGIGYAASEVIAFIDDDAIPEPNWLENLSKIFSDKDVGAAGGFVRGRNGINFQWRGLETDQFGRDFSVDVSGTLVRGLNENRVLKIQGTNMAFRATALQDVGDFDEAFTFYFEETDLTRRIASSGWKIAMAAFCEVTHGDAPSAFRSSQRVPRSLEQLSKSWRYFIDKHGGESDMTPVIKELYTQQHKRLVSLMKLGWIEPRDVRRMLGEFESGMRQSPTAMAGNHSISDQNVDFVQFIAKASPPKTLSGSIWQKKQLQETAKKLADEGHPVSLSIFSKTALFHRRRFHADGYWIQTGGQFGRAHRWEPIFRWNTRKARSEKERRRIATESGYNWQ